MLSFRLSYGSSFHSNFGSLNVCRICFPELSCSSCNMSLFPNCFTHYPSLPIYSFFLPFIQTLLVVPSMGITLGEEIGVIICFPRVAFVPVIGLTAASSGKLSPGHPFLDFIVLLAHFPVLFLVHATFLLFAYPSHYSQLTILTISVPSPLLSLTSLPCFLLYLYISAYLSLLTPSDFLI